MFPFEGASYQVIVPIDVILAVKFAIVGFGKSCKQNKLPSVANVGTPGSVIVKLTGLLDKSLVPHPVVLFIKV